MSAQTGGDEDTGGMHVRKVTPEPGADSGRVNLPPAVVDKLGVVGGGQVVILVRDGVVELRSVGDVGPE